MSKKIYISPSDQTKNFYAVGNTNEAEQCRRIALALVDALERCGYPRRTLSELRKFVGNGAENQIRMSLPASSSIQMPTTARLQVSVDFITVPAAMDTSW